MKKILFSVVLLIIIAIAGGVYYVMTNLDAIIKAVIEEEGTKATKTRVRVGKVKLEFDYASKVAGGGIHGLTVANPGGFEMKHAFSLDEISTSIDLASLQQEPYVIKEVTVKAPKVFVEVNEDKKNNLNELKKNLASSLPKDDAGKQADSKQTDKSGEEPKIRISKLTFVDGTIDAKIVPLKKDYQLRLPAIRMSNLGGKNGATPAEIANEIMNRLIDEAKREVRKKGIDAELDKLKSKAKAKVEEEKAKLKEKADEKVDAEKEKLEGKLKGLFNK